MWRILALLALLITPAWCEEPTTTRELLSIVNERSLANNQRFDAQEKAVVAALAAAKEAVTKAESAAEKRFDSVNEFRASLKDQQATFITRNEVDIRFKSLDDKITANNQQITQLVARAEGAAQLWGAITVVIGLIVAGMMLFIALRGTKSPVAR